MKFLLLLFLFAINFCFSQSPKDIVLTKTVPDLLLNNNKADYLKVKNLINRLEEEYGDLPDYTRSLLKYSLEYGDIVFFKKEFIHLVREYGLNLNHLHRRNAFYQTLTQGELSEWFWQEYPKHRIIWIKNNHEKLPYIDKLNALYIKDQNLANLYRMAKEEISVNSKNKLLEQTIDSIFLKKTLDHFAEFLGLIQNIGYYPSSKNFALPETPYFLVATHAMKIPSVSMKCLKQIYPYWEKAYLKGKIDYLVFRNFDIQLLMSTGKQYFGTVQYEEIPISFLEHLNLKNKTVPVLNPEGLKERRKKLGWE